MISQAAWALGFVNAAEVIKRALDHIIAILRCVFVAKVGSGPAFLLETRCSTSLRPRSHGRPGTSARNMGRIRDDIRLEGSGYCCKIGRAEEPRIFPRCGGRSDYVHPRPAASGRHF
jgi:hypothetical protein